MKENFLRDFHMEKGSRNGRMESNTLVNTAMGQFMARDGLIILMGHLMRVSLKMIKDMDGELSLGLMDDSTKENGKMGNKSSSLFRR